MLKRIVPILCLASLASACGSSGGGSSSTSTSGSGSTGGSSGGSSGSSGNGFMYCNGSLLSNAGGTFLVGTYPKSDDVRTGCPTAFGGLVDAGTVFAAVSGILDVDSYGDAGSSSVYAIFPAGCDDLGAGSAPALTDTHTVPDGGAVSVAAAISGGATVPLMWGEITFIDAPYTGMTGAHAGSAYIQDLSGASNSGVSIYFPKGSAPPMGGGGAAPGAVGYPAAGLHRGDVVALTNMKWSPYLGQVQFEFQATSAVFPNGTAPLPAAVTLTDSEIGVGVTPAPANIGMRVTVAGPATVADTCPWVLP